MKVNIFRFGAGLFAAAVFSSASIVSGQEQEFDGGAGGVTSEPTESAPVTQLSYDIHDEPDSIIDTGLLEQLDQLRGNQMIEVVIYLDVINDEDDPDDAIDSHLSASYVEDTNQIGETEIILNDPDLSYAIEGLYFEDQLAVLGEREAEQTERKRERRIEKSRKTVEKLLEKLEKKKFNQLIDFNESGGVIIAELRKNEIMKLARFPEYVLSITLPSNEAPRLKTAFGDVRLNTTAWPVRSFGGQSVGIFMREARGQYCFNQSDVQPIEQTIGLGGGNYTEDLPTAPSNSGLAYQHANKVAQALRAASPRSHIYCSDENGTLPSAWKNNIHIVNYSYGAENGTVWDSPSAEADNLSYNENVQLFIVAGNGCQLRANCDVDSPGKSHNALTVGAYDHRAGKIGNFSDWRNPATGATKPEILAPGVNLQFAAGLQTASGTSYAAPLAAGMAASNISVMPSMKKKAALIKASMLAMATKGNITSTGNSRVNGATGIRWNPDGKYSSWDQPHTFLDDANGQWKLLKTYNLRARENARIALSWSNRQEVCDGSVKGHSYTPPSSHLCLGLAMKVVDPRGSTVVNQNVGNRNWQAGNFYTSVAGNYKVYVWRTEHHYEWRKRYPWSSKTYYYSRAKLGLRVAYIDNW